jgi:DNA-directed RNA polymerase subunit alpha
MIMLGEKPWVRYEETGKNSGKFVVEPLEKGYGPTLGNSMRRVLLSSLPGAAITAIKIEGISHSFSTIEGVTEDVLQIILNLKEVVFKSHSDTPKVINLKIKGKKQVTAADFEHDAEVEVVNPDLVIANLDSSAKLEMEAIVERGKGFRTAVRNKRANLPVGYIPIDSIFTPVIKVNLTTEEARVGQEINFDRLLMFVWTNGSITPEEAVRESAKILSRHIEMFVRIGEQVEIGGAASERKDEVDAAVLDMSLDDLELSARSLNCLKKASIKTVGELLSYSRADLMKLENFGAKSLDEVNEKLAEYKLNLKDAEDGGSEA